jgi:hypothetical protein
MLIIQEIDLRKYCVCIMFCQRPSNVNVCIMFPNLYGRHERDPGMMPSSLVVGM